MQGFMQPRWVPFFAEDWVFTYIATHILWTSLKLTPQLYFKWPFRVGKDWVFYQYLDTSSISSYLEKYILGRLSLKLNGKIEFNTQSKDWFWVPSYSTHLVAAWTPDMVWKKLKCLIDDGGQLQPRSKFRG